MTIGFSVTLKHQDEDLRAVDYNIYAYIADGLTQAQHKHLKPLYDPILDQYVLGQLKATRHASPAINLNAFDREIEKNPYFKLDEDIDSRLTCHTDEFPDNIKMHSAIGDAHGLIAVTSIHVHKAARNQSIGLIMLHHLKSLHAGTANFVMMTAEPWMTPGTPWNQVCKSGHQLTMYLCSNYELHLDPVATCDGINLLVGFWDSDTLGAPEENELNLGQVIHQIEQTIWTEI